jgi:hypothetical protein
LEDDREGKFGRVYHGAEVGGDRVVEYIASKGCLERQPASPWSREKGEFAHSQHASLLTMLGLAVQIWEH